jgi:hypothetical protein
VENLRRSISMMPAGGPAAAMTRDAALDLFAEYDRLRDQNLAYGHVVAELRRILETLEPPPGKG